MVRTSRLSPRDVTRHDLEPKVQTETPNANDDRLVALAREHHVDVIASGERRPSPTPYEVLLHPAIVVTRPVRIARSTPRVVVPGGR
jgi:hypothetical protein